MSNFLIGVLPVLITVYSQNHPSLSPCLMEIIKKENKRKENTEAGINLTYTCGVINNVVI